MVSNNLQKARLKDQEAKVMKFGVELQLLCCEIKNLESNIKTDSRDIEIMRKDRIAQVKEKLTLKQKDLELDEIIENQYKVYPKSKSILQCFNNELGTMEPRINLIDDDLLPKKEILAEKNREIANLQDQMADLEAQNDYALDEDKNYAGEVIFYDKKIQNII